MYFWCSPAGKLTGHSSLRLIWLLITQEPFNLSQWVTLRPYQIILWKQSELHRGKPRGSSVQLCAKKRQDPSFPVARSQASFWRMGFNSAAAVCGQGEARRGGWNQELTGACLVNLIRDLLLWSPLCCSGELRAGCGGEWICSSAYLMNYGTGGSLCNPDLRSLCQLAALQHSYDYSSCPCLLCCIRGQTKCVYGWGWHKDVCQESCCICEKVQDSMSVRQIFTEVAAK